MRTDLLGWGTRTRGIIACPEWLWANGSRIRGVELNHQVPYKQPHLLVTELLLSAKFEVMPIG